MDFCSTTDKRRYPRVKVQGLLASVDNSERVYPVLDINLDGLALECEGLSDMARDQVRSLRILRGEEELLHIEQARVTHVGSRKAGFQFQNLDTARRNILFSVIIGVLSRTLD